MQFIEFKTPEMGMVFVNPMAIEMVTSNKDDDSESFIYFLKDEKINVLRVTCTYVDVCDSIRQALK